MFYANISLMIDNQQEKNDLNQKSEVAQNEERVLEFWNKANTFKKSEEKNTPQGEFVFYDGPPFATGLPHYGHILAGTIKDAIPRYQTMIGKKVKRMWGWDCHGLPLENIIEAELGLENKKEIENYGIEKFNEEANSKVLCYANDWEKIIPRMGRWVDMTKPYRTMDTTYTESVWWSFKEIFNKGLIEESFKSMHYCPRCGTTLSNFEVNQGYKDIKDLSVVVKFELVDQPAQGGQARTYVLAWTTTPWTLPGNMGLAINGEAVYCKVESRKSKVESYIVAKERMEKIFENEEYKILEEFNGSELIGKKYQPVFDTYLNEEFENKNNAWQIWGADFVTMEDGTGIVHLAPAFGEDDLNLALKNNLPIRHHVDLEGKFKPEVKEFAGMLVKPKEDHQATDIEVIKYLANKNFLFAKEKIEHSYPHCWRCATPLLNYATSSWFLTTTKIKDEIIAENQKIKWVPENIRDGRFGKWLEGMRDWAISRSRYWGAPLPVWKCEKCKEVKVIGSLEEIKQEIKKNGSQNRYLVIRHGEADNNVQNILSSQSDNHHHLTEQGKEQVRRSAQSLKKEKIDLIFSSPFARTEESAEILSQALGGIEIIYDKRLGELSFGEWEGQDISKYTKSFNLEERFTQSPQGGESLLEVKNRLMEFFYEIDKRYFQKNILIVSHETLCLLMTKGLSGLKEKDLISQFSTESFNFENAGFQISNFESLPHNRKYELDVHRPYIDEIKFKCPCGGQMNNVKEVFDCWYESGSMSYASKHYPFENLDIFDPQKEIGYPADFIAEGLDQTRGWFYSMLVLSVALFGKRAYNNVIVNGLVMAEDGQKMSKSKKNYPDVMVITNKYGADALRYYLLSSPLMKAEDLNFSEKGVAEVLKKNILRFKNVLSFYELYKGEKTENVQVEKSPNVLDQWILVRLNQLTLEVSNNMDNYEIDKATRPIADFVDDLSTWYLRRSRERFKTETTEDKNFAIAVTKYVLENLVKIYAPFMPFIAEEIWQRVTENNFADDNKSVHLEKFPLENQVNENLLEEMKEARQLVSLGLEARSFTGIKVRQPLRKLVVKSNLLQGKESLLSLVKDELNIKEIDFDDDLKNQVELDLTITPELKEEGDLRELLRNLQGLRKEAGLDPKEMIELVVETNEQGKFFIEKFSQEIKKIAGISKINFMASQSTVEISVGDYFFKVKIIR